MGRQRGTRKRRIGASAVAQTNSPLSPGELHLDGALEHGLFEGNASRGNKLVPVLLVAAIAASGLSMLFSIGTAVASAGGSGPSETKVTTPAPYQD
jgi:hypothetical protein